ncbi:GntR family transcriptional regulator [Kyrpidia sp.]|uniref:GntR family transcriptional regulator n=1 Tax=Kyrpidia sp. TaxID=2073077 RepID=UPI002588EEDF|nr:GntR family transcriptional regulator [Kyrpidia sp.]MCL6576437.1 GntR family transcriptional regulator [Kyrpidia sp.]
MPVQGEEGSHRVCKSKSSTNLLKTRGSTQLLDRHSGRPLYIQIRDELERRIYSGEWKPGDQIATEDELQRLYGVSRITAQRAVNELVKRGLVVRRAGKGTFVTDAVAEDDLSQFINFAKRRPAVEGPHRLIAVTPEKWKDPDAEWAGLREGEEILRLERLKIVDDRPFALEISLIPMRYATGIPEADLENLILYPFFRERGIRLAYAKMYVKPHALTDQEANLLEMPSGMPVFLWERASFTQDRSLVELTRFILRSDTRRFFVEFSLEE